jgi:hypothetical protein
MWSTNQPTNQLTIQLPGRESLLDASNFSAVQIVQILWDPKIHYTVVLSHIPSGRLAQVMNRKIMYVRSPSCYVLRRSHKHFPQQLILENQYRNNKFGVDQDRLC